MENKTKKYHIAITGGHLTPSLAMIEEFSKYPNDWQVTFIGRTTSQEGSTLPSRELQEVSAMNNIIFIGISAGKLPRYLGKYFFHSLFKFPQGIKEAWDALQKTKPDIILSFGGYVALPVVLAAVALGIPVVTHEQTVTKGLANLIIDKFATKVALSWETDYLSLRKNEVVTGNPLRSDFFSPPQTPPLLLIGKLPLLYVTGGNLGSKAINEVIRQSLDELLERFEIVHQCGSGEAGKDIKKLRNIVTSADEEKSSRYHVQDWFNAGEVSWLMQNARIIISRSGANTVTEIAFIGTPAILIPLPKSAKNEQKENAQLLKHLGLVEIIDQDEFTEEKLLQVLESIQKNYGNYKHSANATKQLVKPNAAKNIRKVVEDVLKEAQKKN